MILLSSFINTLAPALAVALALDLGFRLVRSVNASTRYVAWWLTLAVVLTLPLGVQVARMSASLSPPTGVEFATPIPDAAEPVQEIRSSPGKPPAEAFPVRVSFDRFVPFAATVWLAISGAFLARIFAGFVWVIGVRRNSRVLASHREQFEELLDRRGLRGRVTLLENDAVPGPMLAGFFRPAVVVPCGLANRISARELEDVLLHEIAHLLRRDQWTNLLGRIIGAVLWFHPAVVWILRRQEQDREMACDEWAAHATGEQRRYAASLARLAELRLAGRTGLIATGALGRGVSLSKRIESLLANRGAAASVAWMRLTLVMGCVAGLATIAPLITPLIAAGLENEAQPPRAVRRAVSQVRGSRAVSESGARPVSPGAKPGSQGFLAGLVAAGYGDISVDEVIDLKNNGVSPDYIAGMSQAGLGRLTPRQLIELHTQGVRPESARDLAQSGFSKLSVREVIDMSVHGVRPGTIAEIHRLGFGPYTPQEAIEMTVHGVNPELLRALKESGTGQAGVREIIEATVSGLTAKDVHEARSFGAKLSFAQIVKLKKAGVI